MAVIAMNTPPQALVICNGYKDSTYIRAALIAQKMGHTVYIIIDKLSEWNIIKQESRRLRIHPQVGVRIRLVSKGTGLWENTGGEKSKFGLSAAQVLQLVSEMSHSAMLDCLQIMHCHMGSEIANIQDINACMQEISQYYVALRKLNVPIHTLDLGGGLSVDYAGTQSATGCSMNYSLYDYASTILSNIQRICVGAQLPQPHIITESGRALTAHHAVLITNITDVELGYEEIILPVNQTHTAPEVLEMWQHYQSLSSCLPSEVYAAAYQSLIKTQHHFLQGTISLQNKAIIESLFKKICLTTHNTLDTTQAIDCSVYEQLSERLAAKVFCNLSFFQSMPDAWALNQVFPVAPISQLLNKRSMPSILEDLTCDSDGTLSHYVGGGCVNSTIALPKFDKNSSYNLGFFLVGAYQETLGNLHNLFGDTSSIAVTLRGDGQFSLLNRSEGDTVSSVLSAAQFDCKTLLLSYQQQLKQSDLPDHIIQSYLTELSTIFSQSTYLRV
jgi:arginine decarboxylase